jgi:hypothetical protein
MTKNVLTRTLNDPSCRVEHVAAILAAPDARRQRSLLLVAEDPASQPATDGGAADREA